MKGRPSIITQKQTLSSIRKVMPPPSRAISSKKGKIRFKPKRDWWELDAE